MSNTDLIILEIAIYWPILIFMFNQYPGDRALHKLETRMEARFEAHIEALSKRIDNVVDREYRSKI